MRKKEFLGPRETFEVYEKRTHSPLNARIPSPLAMVPAEQQQQFPSSYPSVAFVPIQQEKRKVPLKLIIGLAVAIPVFVILMLFLAVWLQEMGVI